MALRVSARLLREITTGREAEPPKRTTSTGKSDAGKVAVRNPSQEQISRRLSASAAGRIRSAGRVTEGV